MRFTLVGLLLVMLCSSGCTSSNDERTLVIYSARNEQLIKPLIDLYIKTQDPALKIDYITDDASALLVRLEAENKTTQADLLITVDVGNLWQAQQRNLLSPIKSAVLDSMIPKHLRQADNMWFGLSVRARTIVYSTERVDPEQLVTYEDLANSKWHGRLCLRTAKKVYNQSLVASLIANLGEEKTEEIVSGWVNNLATDVFSSDTQVMDAILAGQCDVGVVNTYYFGRLMKEKPDAKLALFWPNQSDRGVHINISGAGVTRFAKNRDDAIAFLEWLAKSDAQRMIADENQEYPANPNVSSANEVAAWGKFKADKLAVELAGKLQKKAIKLMDRVGYH